MILAYLYFFTKSKKLCCGSKIFFYDEILAFQIMILALFRHIFKVQRQVQRHFYKFFDEILILHIFQAFSNIFLNFDLFYLSDLFYLIPFEIIEKLFSVVDNMFRVDLNHVFWVNQFVPCSLILLRYFNWINARLSKKHYST